MKFGNVLISDEGYIKICDFGLSRNIKEGNLPDEQCGTKPYMAPELLKKDGNGYDHMIDWWALVSL